MRRIGLTGWILIGVAGGVLAGAAFLYVSPGTFQAPASQLGGIETAIRAAFEIAE
jgi:hypothetical protein